MLYFTAIAGRVPDQPRADRPAGAIVADYLELWSGTFQ
jgi:hypothetical protein